MRRLLLLAVLLTAGLVACGSGSSHPRSLTLDGSASCVDPEHPNGQARVRHIVWTAATDGYQGKAVASIGSASGEFDGLIKRLDTPSTVAFVQTLPSNTVNTIYAHVSMVFDDDLTVEADGTVIVSEPCPVAVFPTPAPAPGPLPSSSTITRPAIARTGGHTDSEVAAGLLAILLGGAGLLYLILSRPAVRR